MAQPPDVEWADAARLLHSLGHAVITTDLDGRIVDWNPAAEKLYGWPAEEVLGRTVQEVTVPEPEQEFAEEIMAALREGRPWSGGFTVRRKDGSTFPALVTDAGIADDGGRLVGIVGVSTDLGHALRPLLARSSDAALILARDGVVTFVSPPTVELFGWSQEQVVGRSLFELVHPEDRETAIRHFRRQLGHGEPVPPLECRFADGPDTAYRWIEVVMTSLLDDPAVRGIVCNLRDVTQRRVDRDQLARLSEQLQQALSTRVVIEQAKGMVAAQRGIGVEEAFGVLRRHARDHNASLQAVASAVVSLGLRP